MGKFTFSKSKLEDWRPVCRPARWQDASQATGSPLRRATSMYIVLH